MHICLFLSYQLVIRGADVGDLHLRGLSLPWHSRWRALQVAQRGPSHGQAWQLHQRAVSFTLFWQADIDPNRAARYLLHPESMARQSPSDPWFLVHFVRPLHSCDSLLLESSFTISSLQSADNGTAVPWCHTERADGEQSREQCMTHTHYSLKTKQSPGRHVCDQQQAIKM